MARTPEQTALYNAVERICALHARIPEGYEVVLILSREEVELSVYDPHGNDLYYEHETGESALAAAIDAAEQHAKESNLAKENTR